MKNRLFIIFLHAFIVTSDFLPKKNNTIKASSLKIFLQNVSNSSLYSTSFSSITIFNCYDDPKDRLELLRELSQSFIGSIIVLDVDSDANKLADFAWYDNF